MISEKLAWKYPRVLREQTRLHIGKLATLVGTVVGVNPETRTAVLEPSPGLQLKVVNINFAEVEGPLEPQDVVEVNCRVLEEGCVEFMMLNNFGKGFKLLEYNETIKLAT
jgi:hypothetical protein